jgi:hypothetical protein
MTQKMWYRVYEYKACFKSELFNLKPQRGANMIARGGAKRNPWSRSPIFTKPCKGVRINGHHALTGLNDSFNTNQGLRFAPPLAIILRPSGLQKNF